MGHVHARLSTQKSQGVSDTDSAQIKLPSRITPDALIDSEPVAITDVSIDVMMETYATVQVPVLKALHPCVEA